MKEILVAYNKNNKNCKGLSEKLLYEKSVDIL